MEIDLVKEKLETELKETQAEQRQLAEQLDQKPDFGLGKGSTGSQEWEMALARQREIAARIEALEEALVRVAEGTYARCQECGQLINPERLEILPTTTLCVRCAAK